jgi:oligopeptide transport system ATP-binding protein
MMVNQKETILRVDGLKQYFKTGIGKNKILNKAVDGISFEVKKGEVFSLVGESGCGKTTTGRTIIQLYKSSGGEVHFHDTRILSDIDQAKKTYKENLAILKNQFASNEIDEMTFKELLLKQKMTLNEAKKDYHFERNIDEEGKNKLKNLNDIQEVKNIKSKYESIIDVLKKENVSLDSKKSDLNKSNKQDNDEIKHIVKHIKKNQKEIRLNKLRQKQDIDKLKFELINKNRLLMRKMQMIFQDPIASLNPRMTVREIVAEGLRINGVKNELEIDQRVKESLETVGLVAEHASRYPHEFSGGQRQRIGIARALIVEPTFIIADEPISALDVSIRAHIINLLNELREKKGISILFIAHDLSVVKYFSDRLAVMYFGHIVEVGNKEKIFSHPCHPYTLSLLDSIPLPDPLHEKRRVKSIRYNPQTDHDYSIDKPRLREIESDHFVLCNETEYQQYKSKLS